MKFRDFSGAVLMAVFGLIALGRSLETGLLFFVLLALRDFIASYFFLARCEADQKSQWTITFLAYVSAALPLCYSGIPLVIQPQTQMLASLLIIFGFTVVALATIDLSNRMGISPAVRGDASAVFTALSRTRCISAMSLRRSGSSLEIVRTFHSSLFR
jgi:hypothetical protein